jgi:hypothetical protein
VDRFKHAAFRLLDMPEVRTIVIDSGTHLYEDMLFACYGRDEKIMPLDRKVVNREMREFLAVLAQKHLIITHESKEVWRLDRPTGRHEATGWKHIGYFASIELEMEFDPAAEDGPFFLSVRKCQENVTLVGRERLLRNGDITFANVAALVWPDAEPEIFE